MKAHSLYQGKISSPYTIGNQISREFPNNLLETKYKEFFKYIKKDNYDDIGKSIIDGLERLPDKFHPIHRELLQDMKKYSSTFKDLTDDIDQHNVKLKEIFDKSQNVWRGGNITELETYVRHGRKIGKHVRMNLKIKVLILYQQVYLKEQQFNLWTVKD